MEGSYSREEVIAATRDFHELLIKLPYIEPDALVLPPPESRSGVNTEAMRCRGKTEEAIELLLSSCTSYQCAEGLVLWVAKGR